MGIARGIGVGNVELRQDVALMPLHVVGLVVGQVIVSQQVQKAMHDEMDEVMVECLVFGARLAASVS